MNVNERMLQGHGEYDEAVIYSVEFLFGDASSTYITCNDKDKHTPLKERGLFVCLLKGRGE